MNRLVLQIIGAVALAAAAVAPASARSSATENLEAIQRGEYSQLSPEMQAAVATAQASAQAAANLGRAPASTVQLAVRQSAKMLQQAKEAYIAALPPRDRAIGTQVLLGDGSAAGGQGKLYYFISRSMPVSLLRAYALDALYTGGTLVVKGLRKGDTVKEYLEEVIEDFNSAEGQLLSGMEINPNLFDMFRVTVVPAVVWTLRTGLDDIGSGCENLPEGTAPKLALTGPDDNPIQVETPICAPAPATSYYKIAGALTTSYVLDRFQEAGAPKEAMDTYRSALAERHSDVHDGTQRAGIGQAMAPIPQDIRLSSLPRHVLAHWQDELAHKSVQRGPYGPVFNGDVEDDPEYRRELLERVEHGLGL